MFCLVLITLASISSSLGGPLLYSAPVVTNSAAVPAPLIQTVRSQFHSQDELGQYAYGYSNEHSSKIETKAVNGLTSGGYSYIDPNGLVQNVNYVSDDVNGFRVAASNLPVAVQPNSLPVVPVPVPAPAPVSVGTLVPEPPADTPEVKEAREKHLLALGEAEKAAASEPSTDDPIASESTTDAADEPETESKTAASEAKSETSTAKASPAVAETPVKPEVAYAVESPATVLRTPSFIPIVPFPGPLRFAPPLAYPPHPFSPIRTQYHTQDEAGHYAYGYSGGPSSKEEIKAIDGITRGAYNYLDANGIVQSVNYVADPELGFNVVATNLPQPVKPIVAES